MSQADCDATCKNGHYRFSLLVKNGETTQQWAMGVPNFICMCASVGLKEQHHRTNNNIESPDFCGKPNTAYLKLVNPTLRNPSYPGPIKSYGYGCYDDLNFYRDYKNGTSLIPMVEMILSVSGLSDAGCQELCYLNGAKYSVANPFSSYYSTRPESVNGFRCFCSMDPPSKKKLTLPTGYLGSASSGVANCRDGFVNQVWEDPKLHAPVKYVARNTKPSLCSDGTNEVQTEYTGKVCRVDADGTEHIQWDSMKTLAPITSNMQAAQCSWNIAQHRHWIQEWGGYCGVAPKEFPNMPTTKGALP